MWNYNGKVIREGRAWTDDDGTQHPANWNIWSADEKISKGLVWVDVSLSLMAGSTGSHRTLTVRIRQRQGSWRIVMR
jgi:hypothetical protein